MRKELDGIPEFGLKNALTQRETAEEFGHTIYNAMKTVGAYFQHINAYRIISISMGILLISVE